MSQTKDQEYFSDGLSEELLNLLAQVPQIRVIARTSSFAFKGKEAGIAEIAKTLNVANVLEGSVRKSGDTLRITAQLIRTVDSSHLWSETYDRQLTDVFKVQDEIAAAVVAQLKVKLLPAQLVTNLHRTANTEAYNQYLLGNQFYNRNSLEGYRLAITAYQKAVALDPGYAAAYAGLAFAELYAADYAVRPRKTPRQGSARRRPRTRQLRWRRNLQMATRHVAGCARASRGIGVVARQISRRRWRSSQATPRSSVDTASCC